ncbi:hypothetical protein [Sinisalibacter aestuarii]|uniref:Uncharacterized protein n=1 Tax=Sinisalibacter aestuarii TaxID=2949426 RepID=A0ABQ5LU49_9RHOB|nr:hypothetical protein [Sinisalibacter aestuarii]GKY87876.1 hypothetical protein STA1M1_17450 [Sinisalibacter aestuarii]
MKKLVSALGLSFAAVPLFAGALAFEPVAPEGLDATAEQMVEALQAGMPAQMAAFEAQGFGSYGAIAVPKGVELKPELLASVANHESAEAARIAVLDACSELTGAECTVIGLIVPAGN